MRRFLAPLTIAALAALVAAVPAAAKGPSAASLTGPGLDHPLSINGDGEGDTTTPLGALAQLSGFFPEVFEQIPDPTTRKRPSGDLGPRYQILYRVPGPSSVASTIAQDVYPYAKPSPVTYVRPGQVFWGVNHTYGGWVVADRGLKAVLVHAGLPASAPTAGGSFPWAWTGAGVLVFGVLLALALHRADIVRLRTVKSTA